ncbi:CTD kinase subunit gamma CTK3-domain-containing protein [Tuber borchii]|uniref:CTD kinase subunit gamma CTK3-domain-containing protein n=1 Tax=Tuber borchii TaxID=42251 RepID=A0A2T6ZIM1_TUBBO|nr:CTD kinase subunit gamma CTK3-domain-containing protein [Tuber borchii]
MSAADDPFTCRLSFTRLLSRLNASAGASKQCAQFALRNRELDEDLFSVILEQLQSEEITMNTRVNMLYFIEVLCEHSVKADYSGYTNMIQRDILQVVDAVVPNDPEGAANVGTVRKVMQNLRSKGFVNERSIEDVTALLAEKEREYRESIASPAESDFDDDDEEPGNEGRNPKRKFDDSVIQQRMEEDRERHKRLRENIWAIPFPDGGLPNPEFEKSWDQVSDLNEDDYEIMREENQILAASIV